MTTDLMKPRYKVQAGFPQMAGLGFFMDDILFADEINGKLFAEGVYLDGYPHLFRKLFWWEDRKPDDMEQVLFVKSLIDQKVYKVISRNEVSFRGERKGELNIDYPWSNVIPQPVDDDEYQP